MFAMLLEKRYLILFIEKVQITHLKYGQSPDDPFDYFLVQFGS